MFMQNTAHELQRHVYALPQIEALQKHEQGIHIRCHFRYWCVLLVHAEAAADEPLSALQGISAVLEPVRLDRSLTDFHFENVVGGLSYPSVHQRKALDVSPSALVVAVQVQC